MYLLTLTLAAMLHSSGAAGHPCDNPSGTLSTWLASATKVDVVVVGGGAAGLSAAKVLLTESTADTVLLEAQDYLGGRVKTYREGNILVEDGAEWINGGASNRLYSLANDINELTQPLSPSAYDWRAKAWDGTAADAGGFDVAKQIFAKCEEDGVLNQYHKTGYGKCYTDRFDTKYANSVANPSEKAGWLHYLHMWVNKDMGTSDWMDMSARDADHFTDWGLDEWNQWKDGYETLIYYLRESVPDSKIKTSTPVCKVFWDRPANDDKVLVVTANGASYLASHVIFTASIGHLKERHTHIFQPSLPSSYKQAMAGVVLGIANKVQMGWLSPWWGSKPLNLHIIFPKKELPLEKSWLYGVMEVLTIHQQASMLQGFMAGKHAISMEELTEAEVKSHFLQHLRDVTGQKIPDPSFFRRSQWMSNPWMIGSYNSYVTVEGNTNGLFSRTPLTEPLVNSNNKKVLWWAGEHTNNTRYGTVDGAMYSGETIAYNLIDTNKQFWI